MSSSLVNQLGYSNALLVSSLRFGEIAIGLSSTRGQATGIYGREGPEKHRGQSQGSYNMGTYQIHIGLQLHLGYNPSDLLRRPFVGVKLDV